MSLILGVGNRLRGDDAAGLLVIEGLRAAAPPGLRLETLEGTALELCSRWEPEERVVIVDAMSAGGAPGVVRRFDALAAPIPAEAFDLSTHALGLARGIELARALDQLPRALLVIGIEGQRFDFDTAPTPAVAAACEALVRELLSQA